MTAIASADTDIHGTHMCPLKWLCATAARIFPLLNGVNRIVIFNSVFRWWFRFDSTQPPVSWECFLRYSVAFNEIHIKAPNSWRRPNPIFWSQVVLPIYFVCGNGRYMYKHISSVSVCVCRKRHDTQYIYEWLYMSVQRVVQCRLLSAP